MPSPGADVKEGTFVRALLKYFGIGMSNVYLVTALVAWMRAESGASKNWIGNNPFNIRKSKYAVRYRKGRVGTFAVFKNATDAAKATAYFLKTNRGYGYERIIAAITRGVSTKDNAAGEKDRQTQGYDVLAAIALSKWSSDHYGIGKNATLETYDVEKNRIVRIWRGMSQSYASLPAETVTTTKPERVKIHAPLPLDYHEIPYDFIDGQEAKRFYEARSGTGLAPMGGGLTGTI